MEMNRRAKSDSSYRVQRAKRAGVSIIEVTFSIGVVIVGVLGVVTLMPLAHRQAERGVSLDRASSTATQAEEEFGVRGMAYLPSWRLVDPQFVNGGYSRFVMLGVGFAAPQGSPVPFQIFEKHLAKLNADNEWVWTPASQIVNANQFNNMKDLTGRPLYWVHAGSGFCIDSRFLALAGNRRLAATENGQQVNLFGRYFPYTPEQPGVAPNNTIQVRFQRVGLRAFPGNVLPDIMSLLQADELFVSRDDLAFSRPTDPTLPPVQVGYDPGPDGAWGVAGVDDDTNGITDDHSEAGAGDDSVYQRQYVGGFSWIAILTPKLQGLTGVRDLYSLNIVVMQNRQVSMWSRGADDAWGVIDVDDDNNGRIDDIYDAGAANSDDLIDPQNERVAFLDINSSYQNEFVLVTRPGRPASDLDVNVGQWFMVTSVIQGAIANSETHVAKWYRVTGATNKPEPWGDGTQFSRRLTVNGPDWNFINHFVFQLPEPSGPPRKYAEAVLMPNVLNVHEKTIRIESSSLWTIE